MNEPEKGPDVSAQLKKIAEHLVFLERKLDTLLEQSRKGKSFGNSGFKPRGFAQEGYRRMDRDKYGQRVYAPHGKPATHHKKLGSYHPSHPS